MPDAIAARAGHPLRQLTRPDLLRAERDRALAHLRRKVVVVALESVARDPEARREPVQLLEARVADEVAPVREGQARVGVRAQLVDQDRHGDMVADPAAAGGAAAAGDVQRLSSIRLRSVLVSSPARTVVTRLARIRLAAGSRRVSRTTIVRELPAATERALALPTRLPRTRSTADTRHVCSQLTR